MDTHDIYGAVLQDKYTGKQMGITVANYSDLVLTGDLTEKKPPSNVFSSCSSGIFSPSSAITGGAGDRSLILHTTESSGEDP